MSSLKANADLPMRKFISKFKSEDGSSTVFNKILQIVVGLLVLYIIYIVSLVALRSDKLGMDTALDMNKKQMVTILEGYAESSQISGLRGIFNTAVETAYDYVPIRPSVNLKGGAQFTYSLWMYAGGEDYVGSGYPGKTIFIKGDSTMYNFKVYQPANSAVATPKRDVVSYCPMLVFGANRMEFTIRFNTLHNMDERFEIKRLATANSVMRHNVMSLFEKKWVMLTMSFEDNMPINDFENGILIKFYVNDVLYQTGRFKSALKQNSGNLYTFPNGTVTDCRISNFNYFNYAVTPDEVRRLAERGPSDKPLRSVTQSFLSPSWLSDYNRLDIYNT